MNSILFLQLEERDYHEQRRAGPLTHLPAQWYTFKKGQFILGGK